MKIVQFQLSTQGSFGGVIIVIVALDDQGRLWRARNNDGWKWEQIPLPELPP